MNSLPRIFPELVPRTAFGSNLRSILKAEEWDWLRKETYKQAGNACECCGAKGRMEAHEIWHYDDKNHIQKLDSLICLCASCHECFHLGFASIKGRLPQAEKHLAKVNGWSAPETKEFIDIVFEIWSRRSQVKWSLDLSFLDKCGIGYTLPSKEQRAKDSEKIK